MTHRTIAEQHMHAPIDAEERAYYRCQRLCDLLIAAAAQSGGISLQGTFVRRDDLVAALRRRGYRLTQDYRGEWFAERETECSEELCEECGQDGNVAECDECGRRFITCGCGDLCPSCEYDREDS